MRALCVAFARATTARAQLGQSGCVLSFVKAAASAKAAGIFVSFIWNSFFKQISVSVRRSLVAKPTRHATVGFHPSCVHII
jgi:hypothetical protein